MPRERLGVHLDELQPTALASFGPGIEAVPPQDVDHRRRAIKQAMASRQLQSRYLERLIERAN